MSLYKIARAIVAVIFYPLFRIKVIGRENIPKTGPVIICSNHISNFDPPVVGITSSRDISFMAKEELFRTTFLNKLLTNLNAFPIKRGAADRSALRKTLNILKEGRTLGLFPEGTRSKTGELGKAQAGIGFFALRSKAEVIPCVIIGPYKLFKRLTVVYGEPLDMEYYREQKLSAKEMSEVIMEEIQALKKKHEK